MKKVFIVLVFLGYFCNVLAVTLLQVTSDLANIRETRNGKVIDKLPKKSLLALVKIEKEWINIAYKKNDEPDLKYGWVHISLVKIMKDVSSSKVISGDDCSYAIGTNQQVCVTVKDVQFKCRENFMGTGYEKCTVDVDYFLDTDYRDKPINVDIRCEAKVSYETRNSIIASRKYGDETASHFMYSYQEFGNLSIIVKLFDFDDVIKAQLSSVECKINYIFAY